LAAALTPAEQAQLGELLGKLHESLSEHLKRERSGETSAPSHPSETEPETEE
jgi:hypothetical protein